MYSLDKSYSKAQSYYIPLLEGVGGGEISIGVFKELINRLLSTHRAPLGPL
jgi:hypothetical protein